MRLSPVYADQKIFVGSDDGYIYCLDADNGELIWRYQAGPTDRRIPGNGRGISQWPVRGGFVVENKQLYYCAGIFPSQGVFIGALDTESGKSLWKKPVSAAPQGHILSNKEQLFVPTGRTPFRSFSKSDGAPTAKLGRSTSWGRRLHGGCFGVVIDEKLASGPSEDGHLDIFTGKTSVDGYVELNITAQTSSRSVHLKNLQYFLFLSSPSTKSP